jgi:hypothetical protein
MKPLPLCESCLPTLVMMQSHAAIHSWMLLTNPHATTYSASNGRQAS